MQKLRAGIAVVLQDVFLFTGSIRENISMGAELSDSELRNALELSDAWDFLDSTSPERVGGLDSGVSEQGLNYSTGERQLLSFARAIASDPGVLILDEATAHIDTETEQRVQKAIESVSEGRTSIFIAHRLSTIRNSDVIFYLENGKIAESGTHDELLKLGGKYAALVASK